MAELRFEDPDPRTLKEILDSVNEVAVTLDYMQCRAIQEDIAEIANRFAAGGWISVDDALPKTDVRVIVYCDDPFDITIPPSACTKILMIGYLDIDRDWYDSDGPLENITHWMPLPEPPKVKE